MKSRRSNVSIESIMVMVLMIAFSISVSLMITQGSQLFKESIDNKNHDENLRIAMSYVNMRVKQNDVAQKIYVVEKAIDGIKALVIEHQDEELGYKSYIYYDEGYLMECYTDETPRKDMATRIIDSGGIEFKLISETSQLIVNYNNKELDIEQVITLRSK